MTAIVLTWDINVVLAAPYPRYYTELFWTKILRNTNHFCTVFLYLLGFIVLIKISVLLFPF